MLTNEQLTAAYEAALEDTRPAGSDVQEAADVFEDAVMAYLTAIQYETFCWAYALGYEAGANKKEGAQA